MKHLDDTFKNSKLTFFCQSWLPDKELKAILLVVHGLAEHSGRYLNLVNRLVPEGCGVSGFDLRGHSKSEGARAHVNRFDNYASDLKIFHEKLKSEYPNREIFLMGHSMGAVIALSYALKYQQAFRGLVLSGAIIRQTDPRSALAVLACRALSAVFPCTGVLRLDAGAISRDEKVVRDYESDPLVYRGHVSARLGVELLAATHRLPREVSVIKTPVLLLHGGADRIADPRGSELVYQNIGSKDKTMKLYPGCYHEVFNDFGREKALDDLQAWLEEHI